MTSRVASGVYRQHAAVGAGDRAGEGGGLAVWLEEQPTSSTIQAIRAATKPISRLPGDIVTIYRKRWSGGTPASARDGYSPWRPRTSIQANPPTNTGGELES